MTSRSTAPSFHTARARLMQRVVLPCRLDGHVVAQRRLELTRAAATGSRVGGRQPQVSCDGRQGAREVVEEVGVVHQQMVRVVRRRGEEVSQPQAGRLRPVDPVLASRERGRDLHGSRTSTIVVAIGITVRQNGKSSEIRGSSNAITPRRDAGAPNTSSMISDARAEGIEAGLLCPTGIEHRRLIPRSAEVSEQSLVEFA